MTESKNFMRKRLTGYWIKNAEIQFLTIMGVFLFYFLWQYVVIGGTTLENVLMSVPYLTKMLGAFMIVIYQASSNKNTFSMALAFGSTRREAFTGHQIALGIEAAQILFVNVLLDIVVLRVEGTALTWNVCGYKVLFNLAILFLAMGLGQIGATVVARLGNKAIVIISIFFGTVFAIGIGGGLLLVKNGGMILANWNQIVWVSFVAGFVIYITGILTERRYLLKMEVTI